MVGKYVVQIETDNFSILVISKTLADSGDFKNGFKFFWFQKRFQILLISNTVSNSFQD